MELKSLNSTKKIAEIIAINLRKNVWFHILSHIGCSENIDFESMLKGINVLVKLYRDEKDNKYLKIIEVYQT